MQIFEQLSSDTLIITANKRLSRWLNDCYFSHQIKQGLNHWPRLNCLPIGAWLHEIWRQIQLKNMAPGLTLLNSNQAMVLWEEIIRNTPKPALLNLDGTVQHAMQAWELLQAWQISLNEDKLLTTPDGRQLTYWATQFKHLCDEKHYLDEARLTTEIIRRLKQNKLELPKHIICIGFLELTPRMQSLFNAIKALGITIELKHFNHRSKSISRIGLLNKQEEITTMARWAKAYYDEDASQQIACIVPNLYEIRDDIQRTFSAVFQNNNAFNISSGKPLINEPIIQIVFTLLALSTETLSINEISNFLQSPFILNAESERTNRSLLDSDIRDIGNRTYTLTQLLKHIPNDTTLFKPLSTLNNTKEQKIKSSKWVEIFWRELQQLGWPGERELNTKERQAIEHFKKTLQQFAQLDLIKPQLTRSQAIHYLKKVGTAAIFQTKTTSDKIQILGSLEAHDLLFDHVWVVGLDDHHWPSGAHPNPLLPLSLQRETQMPHASSERELEYAKQMTKQFISRGKNVVLSYPLKKEEAVFEPSSLITEFKEIALHDLNLSSYSPKTERQLAQYTLEHFIDDQAPAISSQEKIRGGTSIFKHQSACPFRAFAKLRLRSEPISEPEIGINALERGLLMHKTLELFWKQTRSQKNLLELTKKEIDALIKKCITQSVKKILVDRELPKHFIQLEKTRLHQLMLRWLDVEKSREPFIVIAEELWQRAEIKGLKISMQVDRIDKLADDNYLLIDYKTGRTDIRKWFGERPEEPQLPLYATTSKRKIRGIAFAELRADTQTFKGISESDITNNDDAAETWPKQLKAWQIILEKLAEDFLRGHAEVDPKDEHTCDYCDQQTFCRIYERY